MEVIDGKKVVISIDITENNEYASLDDSDVVTYSLYDLKGNIIDDIEDVELQVEDSNRNVLKIEIPADANYVSVGEVYGSRILVVDYTLNGDFKTVRKSYRVIKFVPYTCTCSDVRNILGVASNVIEDSMIDLYESYITCKSKFTGDILDDALTSGGLKCNKANRAISLCSALSFRNSLQILTPKIESDSVVSQTRFTMTREDFESLFDDLQDELNDIIDDLSDVDLEDRYSVDMLVIGTLTDTFTGN